MSDLISRQVLELWNRYKPTIAVDAIEYDRELRWLLSTNLAEVGTDAISRDAVKELLNNNGLPHHINPVLWKGLNELPSAQPDIIRCRNCKFASGDSRICMKFGHSPIGELDFCAWAERITDE